MKTIACLLGIVLPKDLKPGEWRALTQDEVKRHDHPEGH